ncbi:hypothetical protein SAMN05421595_0835 [Austwickia chelonae]|uniref:DUF2231 domain-containing protein n=1 Tax=Austwickia chelonae NBRC 105200 TaxID=1184607 RepID=K6V7W1_9MICO|nr:DUF2231 domain-containing protein [Austwickia chelonae]GAB78318.1 hypothetical protein AUCHE_08_05650 [Austwickia chelonae NBRC 105200]SEW01175.1 hypothetical protein SAMN05421595_0835 [Austwickia chelonae]
MFDSIAGLPAHPLLVHGVVVLLPVAAVATALLLWRPARWHSWSFPVVLLDLLVVGLAVAAKESGEKLEHRVPRSDLVHEHAETGELLPFVALVVLVCALVPAAAVLWTRRTARLRPADLDEARAAAPLLPAAARLVTAVFATLIAVGAIWMTVEVGHSGAFAVWHKLSG